MMKYTTVQYKKGYIWNYNGANSNWKKIRTNEINQSKFSDIP